MVVEHVPNPSVMYVSQKHYIMMYTLRQLHIMMYESLNTTLTFCTYIYAYALFSCRVMYVMYTFPYKKKEGLGEMDFGDLGENDV
jgi:hypothetical protein